MNSIKQFSAEVLGGGKYVITLGRKALFPVATLAWQVRKAFLFCHCSGQHICIIIFADYPITKAVLRKEARREFIELEATTTLPLDTLGNSGSIFTLNYPYYSWLTMCCCVFS